jgi:hypothetical protein
MFYNEVEEKKKKEEEEKKKKRNCYPSYCSNGAPIIYRESLLVPNAVANWG